MGVEYWTPLLEFLKTSMVGQGTIDRADLDRILVTDDVQVAVAVSSTPQTVHGAHWLVLVPRANDSGSQTEQTRSFVAEGSCDT